MFVSIPQRWSQGFSTVGSVGILPALFGILPHNTHHGTPRGAGRKLLIRCAAQEVAANMPATAGNMPVLPDHLFWKWFVDNPRRKLQ